MIIRTTIVELRRNGVTLCEETLTHPIGVRRESKILLRQWKGDVLALASQIAAQYGALPKDVYCDYADDDSFWHCAGRVTGI